MPVSRLPVLAMRDGPAKVDGRRLRSEKTRQAIARAMTDLMSEGKASPTREEIAARAGISVRALFLHFPNVQDLIAAELDRVLEDVRTGQRIDPALPLPERVEAFIGRRAEVVARLAPQLAAATVDRAPEAALQDRIDRIRRRLDEEVRTTFEADLAALPDGDRAGCAIALELLLAPAVWDGLARERGLDGRQIRDLLRAAVLRLLPGSAAAG